MSNTKTMTIDYINIIADSTLICANLGFLYYMIKYPLIKNNSILNIVGPILMCLCLMSSIQRLIFNINNFGNVFNLNDIKTIYESYNYF